MLGCERALVVHGLGLDEIALHGETQAAELVGGEVVPRRYTPADFGVRALPLATISGGGPEENAAAIRALLSGKGAEAHAAAVAVNTAALLLLAGLTDTLAGGYAVAREVIAGGGALTRLERFAQLSRSVP